MAAEMAGAVAEKASLEVLTGGERAAHGIGPEGLTIGRHAANAIRLGDAGASRFHCIIQPSRQGYRVNDLGSRNGTCLNGRRVEAAILRDGDILTIGGVRLRFVVSD